MAISPGTWGDWVDIALSEIDSASQVDDDEDLIFNHLLNNQEILREIQIDTQFDGSTTSASYVNIVTKKLWIPEWCAQPVSDELSELRMAIFLQAYQSSGTDHDIRVRVNGGTWEETLGENLTSWGSLITPAFQIDEVDWVGAAGTEVDFEVEARQNGGGTCFVRDQGGTSFIRRATP